MEEMPKSSATVRFPSKFIEFKEGRLVINLLLFKLKFNLKYNTNKLYTRKADGTLRILKRIPKGLNIEFHGYNSIVIIDSNDNSYVDCNFQMYSNSYVEIEKIHCTKAINLTIHANNNSKVIIKEDFNCAGTCIVAGEGCCVNIGKGCMFSDTVYLRSSDQHKIFDKTTNNLVNKPQDINIGERVWLGHNVTVLKGVTIPNDTIVGTNSTVTKSFEEPNTIIAGIPAKVLKRGIYWER